MLLRLLFVVIFSVSAFSSLAAIEGRFVQKDNLFPRVKISTNFGDILLELDRSKAPITANNFLSYVMDGSYKGTIFHRVERDEINETDFVIQGGGYDTDYEAVSENDPIFNESGNGLKNDMYSVAMAYQDSKPHSGTRQFFFNMDDNDHLNPGKYWGFAVFATVMDGYETLNKIMAVKTDYNEKIGYSFIPVQPVVILDVKVLDPI